MKKIGEISIVIVLLSLGRLAMTVPNLEPIGAAALFGGAMIGSWRLKFLIPILALFLGDLVLALIHPSYVDHLFSLSFFTVYLAFAATVVIGNSIIGKNQKMSNVVNAALLTSVIFFLITNFGSWMSNPFYSKNLTGLIECYTAGLVFYKNEIFGSFFLNSVIGNVVFSTATFGIYQYYVRSRKTVIA